MKKYVIEAARRDLVGFFCRVKTLSGRVVHGTGYYPTLEAAMVAAREWVKGMREMAASSYSSTQLG